MTTSQYVLNATILVWILRANLGSHVLTPRRVLLPLAAAAIAGYFYLQDLPTAGNDLVMEAVGLAAGIAFGLLSALLVRVHRTDRGVVVTAGAAFAALWVAVIGGRMVFAYGSDHWYTDAVVRFSIQHDITGADAWTSAFVLMALAMVATRVVATGLTAARTRPGLTLAA
jgi:hypothetical protein